MQAMQGSDLGWLLVIVAVAAFLAGLCGERLRADPRSAPVHPGGPNMDYEWIAPDQSTHIAKAILLDLAARKKGAA
jgi:hypothetical protein